MPFRISLVSLLCAFLAALTAPDALGHAAFVGAEPAAGTRVESSPQRIALRFTEPLNRGLTEISLVDVRSGERLKASLLTSGRSNELTLRPSRPLPRSAYRIEWHTVSTVDGHALEGSFGFGVRTAAVEGAQQVEQSPLAGGGLVRIYFRALFYVALFFFAGGVMTSALLGRGPPAGWLFPGSSREAVETAGEIPGRLSDRAWDRTLDAGWLAAGSAAATALIDAADAGGGLSLQNASDFLLTNAAGLARAGTVLALVIAVVVASRSRFLAALASVAALSLIALSGHANSAEVRPLALATDWTHLVAAAVWVGGMAQVAVAWLPLARRHGWPLGRAALHGVLERFGRVALPAFFVVATSGLISAVIQLGEPSSLWNSAYGRVLGAKVFLVALIALASYWHALRLRPRLLAANPHPERRAYRRHWRLLFAEPVLGVGVLVAAATLVAFPLPPRQLDDTAGAKPTAVCDPCPLPAPAAGELAVAEQAGSRVAAFWLRRNREMVTGTLRLLDSGGEPVDAPVRMESPVEPCGIGCWRFRRAAGRSVEVTVQQEGRDFRVSVPARWERGRNRYARRLVERAEAVMRRLRSIREEEHLTSGPGTYVRTVYRLRSPDRFAYRTSSGAQSVVIAGGQWSRVRGQPWQASRFGGRGGLRTQSFFRWTPYARAARLLDISNSGIPIASVALMDPATPVWYRLRIDLSTMRVVSDRMVTKAHFMTRRYYGFNEPLEIRRPANAIPVR
jgi:copper transport protein